MPQAIEISAHRIWSKYISPYAIASQVEALNLMMIRCILLRRNRTASDLRAPRTMYKRNFTEQLRYRSLSSMAAAFATDDLGPIGTGAVFSVTPTFVGARSLDRFGTTGADRRMMGTFRPSKNSREASTGGRMFIRSLPQSVDTDAERETARRETVPILPAERRRRWTAALPMIRHDPWQLGLCGGTVNWGAPSAAQQPKDAERVSAG